MKGTAMLEKYHFKTSDNTEIVVPLMQDVIRRKAFKNIQKDYAEKPGEIDDALFEAAKFDKKTMDQLDDLTMRDYQEFVKGWMGQGDAPVGESSAS